LPPGDFELTFEELRRSLLVRGPGRADGTWDAAWRESLVGNLEVMTRQLWQVGIREVFADGSFVEEKDHPMTSTDISCVRLPTLRAEN
jgi:hypothetical protein